MDQNPYEPGTQAAQIWAIAQTEHGLTDEELLTRVGWTEPDGDDARRDLTHQYHDSAGPYRFTEGLQLHAMDWAQNYRADLVTARLYGEHVVDLHRAGDLTVHTSHRSTYPRWLEAHEAAHQADAEAEAQ